MTLRNDELNVDVVVDVEDAACPAMTNSTEPSRQYALSAHG